MNIKDKEDLLQVSEEIAIGKADVRSMNPDYLLVQLEILMKRNGIHPLELIRMSLYLNELVDCGMRGESVTHEFARNATDNQYLLLNLVNVKTNNEKREWNHSPVER